MIVNNVICEVFDWASKYSRYWEGLNNQHVTLFCGDTKLDVTYNGAYLVVIRDDNELYVANVDLGCDKFNVRTVRQLLACAYLGDDAPIFDSLCDRLYSAPDCHNIDSLMLDNDTADRLTTLARLAGYETGRRSETYSAFVIEGTQFIVVDNGFTINVTYIREDNKVRYVNLYTDISVDDVMEVCMCVATKADRKLIVRHCHGFEGSVIDF